MIEVVGEGQKKLVVMGEWKGGVAHFAIFIKFGISI